MHILITGHSRGLGEALAAYYLEHGSTVAGLSRTANASNPSGMTSHCVDFSKLESLGDTLDTMFDETTRFDIAFLNAGVLGPISAMTDTALDDLQAVMDVNLWSNKILLDWLAARPSAPKQIVLISSGAGVRGNYGWGAYALSKAALNMLAQLYAHELPDTHICALAPGLVATAMQEELAGYDASTYPSLERLRQARAADTMPAPRDVAQRIAGILPRLVEHPSGSFVDIRTAYP